MLDIPCVKVYYVAELKEKGKEIAQPGFRAVARYSSGKQFRIILQQVQDERNSRLIEEVQGDD